MEVIQQSWQGVLGTRDETGSSPLILAEYVSPSAIRIGGGLFSHNVHGNPRVTQLAGDTVLAAQIGSPFMLSAGGCDMGVFPFINTETVQKPRPRNFPCSGICV